MADDELERFCAEAYPKLVAALAHQFGDRWLAEDVAQEALIRACDRWDRVGALASPVGWAFHVGTNLGRSWMRRKAAERRAHARSGPDATVHDDPDSGDRLAVRTALRELTPAQRETVVLRYYLGLTPSEVAQVTGSTPGAVRALTHRAVGTLRGELDITAKDEEATDAR